MEERRRRWVSLSGGGAVPTVAFGPPAGPLVLVLPGLSDGCAPLSEDAILADVPAPPRRLRRYRVVLASYRHPLPDVVTTEGLARDMAEVLEGLTGGGPAAVTGHSMGGMVAQHLAEQRPDLVRRLVLSSTVAVADDVVGERLRHWDRLLIEGRHRDFLLDAVAVSYTGVERRRRRLLTRLGSSPDLAPHLDRHLALSAACRSHDARAALPGVTAPTLVLGGVEDPLMRIEAVRALAHLLPSARLVELEGLAHGLPEQGRRRYVRELAAFLGAPTEVRR